MLKILEELNFRHTCSVITHCIVQHCRSSCCHPHLSFLHMLSNLARYRVRQPSLEIKGTKERKNDDFVVLYATHGTANNPLSTKLMFLAFESRNTLSDQDLHY